jgi:SSS family solute:Na+ symporter
MNTVFIYLIVYLLILGYITWSSSRSQSEGDFLNSSKQLTANESTWTTFASLLTGYNFVLGTTFSYLFGFWYLFAFIGAALAFVVLYFFYKKHLSKLQSEYDLFSPGDYFGVRFGSTTKWITNFILILALFLFLVLQLFVNTQLFSSLLGVGSILALIITTGVVCVYLWFGGFKTSVKTDIFQGLLMLPIILAVFSFSSNFTFAKIPLAFPVDQIWFAIGLALLQFLSLVAQAESFQRVFAAKDSAALKKGLTYSFMLLILVAGAIAYIGINFKLSGIAVNPDNLFIEGVLPMLPFWLGSLLTISLIAAFMGTIDSSAFALGTLLANSSNKLSKSILAKTRTLITVSIVLAALASLYLFSFLSSVFALISVISVIGTAFVFSFFNFVNKTEVNILLIVGTITFVAGLIFNFVTSNPLTALIPSGAGIFFAVLYMAWKRIANFAEQNNDKNDRL